MKVLVTDAEYTSLDIEADVLTAADHQLVVASCRTPEDVIEAAAGADALLVQYAPITADVLEALPQLRLVSRYGVGVDVVDTAAASERGVWVCNVPDYATVEVAMHAAAMLLALMRNLAGHDREVRAGRWNYQLGGPLPPAKLLDPRRHRARPHRTLDCGTGRAVVRHGRRLRPVPTGRRLAERHPAARPGRAVCP